MVRYILIEPDMGLTPQPTQGILFCQVRRIASDGIGSLFDTYRLTDISTHSTTTGYGFDGLWRYR